MAAIFIVGLPAVERRMLAIALGQKLDDARAFPPPDFRRERCVPARAEPARFSIRVNGRNLWILVHQPFRRGRGWRAEHHFQAGRAQHVHGAIKPAPVESAALRLIARPGEFTDPDERDAKLAHPPRIPRPPGFRPMFRIVTDAEHGEGLAVFSSLSPFSFKWGEGWGEGQTRIESLDWPLTPALSP